MRDAGNFSPGYDMAAMKRGLERENYRFSIFGGEPLLMPIKDLEEMFRWGLEKFGSNGIQTNGTLITQEHIRIFKQYKVGVGISVDGPDELNDSRWMGTLEKTREATATSMAAIQALCAAGIAPSIIFTLYKGNARGDRLERLKHWLHWLDDLGICWARVHLLEVEDEKVRAEMGLTEAETTTAMLELLYLQPTFARLRLDAFEDMAKLLTADDGNVTCTWNACDPYTTRAVRGVDGLGNASNCGRTNKDGVDWGKADSEGFERPLVLYATPQAEGGCQGCRFFVACKGQCPGTAIGGDWRNRTEQCGTWMSLFDHMERRLAEKGVVPISRSPMLKAVEIAMIGGWRTGKNFTIQQSLAICKGELLPADIGNREHGDHWDAPDGTHHSDGPWEVHGDAGMTEAHGDQPHGDS